MDATLRMKERDTMRILVVEDDRLLNNTLCYNLDAAGYVVDSALTKSAASNFLIKQDYDLIVLDVMLPRLNGLEVLRRIRKEGNTVPILLLTARDAVMDKVSGLDAGADDYITKPFAIEELLARIRVALKRKSTDRQETHKLEIHGVSLDTDRHEVMVAGEPVELTNREFELLHTLMENKNIVMDREKLMNIVCGYEYVGETNIIDVYIRYLRTKIDDRFGIKLITTVRGVGYVIRES